MAGNIENIQQPINIKFNAQHDNHLDVINAEQLLIINEQIGELIENPLMKKEKADKNRIKIEHALTSLNMIYDSDFLNDDPTKGEVRGLAQHFDRAMGNLRSGVEAQEVLMHDFSLAEVDRELLDTLMFKVLEGMNAETKSRLAALHEPSTYNIAPGTVEDSGVKWDKEVVDRLNNFVESLTDEYLKRYQDAASASTDIYSAFADLNIAISEMISSSEVNAEDNTIKLNVTALRTALEELHDALFVSGPIIDQLKDITFDADMKSMADELAQGSGLLVVEGPPGDYHLAVDPSAYNNLKEAFDAFVEGNTVGGNRDIIEIPSGTLQAFQTAVESVNNRVSSDNSTLVERLRSVTNQQQQTTQLFSSLLKEILEANKGFLSKVT